MKFRMVHFVAAVVATVLAGCQFPGFEQPRQAALPLPPPKRAEPPEARGIWIVGAPAVEPRIRAAAAKYEATPDTKPHVVAEGTAPGFRTLCAGTGVEHPDMVLADRAIRADEIKRCAAKGITLTEYTLGPKQYVYVKDSHMMAIPGVRNFVESWDMQGKPVTVATQPS
ncbi:substrate-binding domain-containing protein [Azospirillum sp. sgz301742]